MKEIKVILRHIPTTIQSLKKLFVHLGEWGINLFHRPPKFPTKAVRNKLLGMKRLLFYYWLTVYTPEDEHGT